LSDPYVAVQVLPDPEATSTKLTKFKKGTLNPKFNESFTFDVYAHRHRQ
jgi:Ca2+-dependent lipid-binding protein